MHISGGGRPQYLEQSCTWWQVFESCHGVRYGHCVFKIHRKQNGRDLWWPLEGKFKMAAKTTMKTNKYNISARFCGRILCNTIFCIFWAMIDQLLGSFRWYGFFLKSKVMFKVNYETKKLPYRPTIIEKNCLETNFQFLKNWYGVRYEKYVSKIYHKKMGTISVDLWVKFKMAAKTAVKINKCNILALVWNRALCNTIFSMFYGMANLLPVSF